MKTFHCDHCRSLVFFENVACLKCHHPLGFLPDVLDLSALEPAQEPAWKAVSPAARGRLYRPCANAEQHRVCNWLVPADDLTPFCLSCRLNVLIPDLSFPENLERWHRLELAKRRLLFTLLRLRLPLNGEGSLNPPVLRFQFLAGTSGEPPVRTGHENGLITINVTEADDAVRENCRASLHEPFRTLLGHFRHEIAHYYWDCLIRDSAHLESFRRTFGDDRADYQQALSSHYQNGPQSNWPDHHISAYASAHSWEDWAETWAHYLHMVDTIETAAGFGLSLKPRHPAAASMTARPDAPLVQRGDFDAMLEAWFPLTYALNSLNRSMGLSDLYPFVISPKATEKLRFVHDVIEGASHSTARAS